MIGDAKSEDGDRDETQPPLKKGPGVQYNVPTKNAFEVLEEASRRKAPKVVYEEPDKPKMKRPPPITVPISTSEVDGKQCPDPTLVRKVIQDETVEFSLKFNEKGVIIFTPNSVVHQKVIAALRRKSLAHYSHPTERNRLKRFVLYGLQKLEIDELTKLVMEKHIYPSKISFMSVNRPRFTGQCNYILYFDATSPVTLSSLRETKDIYHTIVQWAHYKPKKSGVSPCRNCCAFGHGADNCGMKANCTICAGPHNYKSCTFLQKKLEGKFEQIHPKHVKCTNCGGQHTATYPNCPKRLDYINMLAATRRTRNPARASNGPARPPPTQVLDERNFPTPVFSNPNYAPQGWTTINRQTSQPTNNHQPTQNHTTSDLFTIEECQSMMNELFSALRGCSCKQDQAKVIADYSFKYFTNFP